MPHTLIVVADASRARLLVADRNKSTFHEILTLAHPEGRLHESEITSDLPGRTFDSHGTGRHSMEQPVSAKQQERINFAKQIARQLDEVNSKVSFDKLILIAAPAMLGLLRDNLKNEITKKVTLEIDKDLTQHSIEQIQNQLPEFLPA